MSSKLKFVAPSFCSALFSDRSLCVHVCTVLYTIGVCNILISFFLTVLVLNKLKGHLVVFLPFFPLHLPYFTLSYTRSVCALICFSVCFSIYLFFFTPFYPLPSGPPGAPFSLYHSLFSLHSWPPSTVQP